MSKKPGEGSKTAFASSNWLALQKKLPKAKKRTTLDEDKSRKRRKLEHSRSPSPTPSQTSYASIPPPTTSDAGKNADTKNGESLSKLRKMIFGQMEYTDAQQLPGKYLSLDCEMVGVGVDGTESSLARVSLVNFYGAVQLDEFVRQRERVVDYRTQFSGVRALDMIKAKPFEEVQKQVADLLKDRILIGHAVYNDLKALLLSHPRPQTRDTQYYAGKFKVSRSKYVALRNLVKQELDVTIQGGEHSSVIDARATMAVYRLHRKEWEKGHKQLTKTADSGKKRKRGEKKELEDPGVDETGGDDGKDVISKKHPPGGGRKGVSSGLTTIIRRGANGKGGATGEKKKWWKELAAGSSKGSLRL